MLMALKPFSHHQGPQYDNLTRFMDIGMATYERFFTAAAKESLKDFMVIVPKVDVAATKDALSTRFPTWPWRVLSEDSLLHPSIPPGWARQQTVKLAAAFLVQTDLYLIVDDDTFAVKPFEGAASLRDPGTGKVLLNRCQIDFPFFGLWSAQALGIDYDLVQREPYIMSITPETFITAEVRGLVEHLIQRHGDAKRWQVFLANNKYTEYLIYFEWLLINNNKHTTLYATPAETPVELFGYATTGPEHDMAERVRLAFTDNANFYFSFVQSSLETPVTKVKDEVLKYI